LGSVSSVNPSLASLFQALTNLGSPIASSPGTMSALESAPTADIVELSNEAVQLQEMDTLLGVPASSAASSPSTLSTG
jgi:hypothetical protein